MRRRKSSKNNAYLWGQTVRKALESESSTKSLLKYFSYHFCLNSSTPSTFYNFFVSYHSCFFWYTSKCFCTAFFLPPNNWVHLSVDKIGGRNQGENFSSILTGVEFYHFEGKKTHWFALAVMWNSKIRNRRRQWSTYKIVHYEILPKRSLYHFLCLHKLFSPNFNCKTPPGVLQLTPPPPCFFQTFSERGGRELAGIPLFTPVFKKEKIKIRVTQSISHLF